jgi:hypothetical protein
MTQPAPHDLDRLIVDQDGLDSVRWTARQYVLQLIDRDLRVPLDEPFIWKSPWSHS